MPERNPIGQLQRRLVELGCPAKALRRIVRETAEHYEDLQRAAQAQGLVGDQAPAHAAELLGNPVELANRHVEALRKSSWWGKYPQMGFGAVPLLLTPFAVLGSLFLGLIILQIFKTCVHNLHLGIAAENFLLTSQIFSAGFGYDASLVLLPIFFCWLARRNALEFKWTLMACTGISLSILLVTLFSILVVQIYTSESAPPALVWYIESYNFHAIHPALSPTGDSITPKFGAMLFEVLSSIQVAAIPLAVAAMEYVRQRYVRARARCI